MLTAALKTPAALLNKTPLPSRSIPAHISQGPHQPPQPTPDVHILWASFVHIHVGFFSGTYMLGFFLLSLLQLSSTPATLELARPLAHAKNHTSLRHLENHL